MPFIIPLTYYFLLPSSAAFRSLIVDDDSAQLAFEYVPIPAAEGAADREEGMLPLQKGVSLTAEDKWQLVKPLLLRYMLPLCEFFVDILNWLCLTFWDIVCVYLVSFLSDFPEYATLTLWLV